ncbi:hypothetical protein [Pseudobacillus badius]|uniref:hypothetical protein n=1 Tax=Bacillus badius TaxID=1455 RepID=UPI0005972531|nr:hypothetical protein [Bacillus badius]KIL75351.1 hypothetical protein SD78_2420 [Bacillus badius]KZR60473.1 hypothetical protein A3781_09920 [Bacillus badius]
MESIIIAIIIGVISVITGRLKGENEKAKKQNTQQKKMPSPSGANVFAQAEQKKEALQTARRQTPKQTNEEARKEAVRNESTSGRLRRLQEEDKKEQKKDSVPNLEVGADDLTKGIILAEILAPPKALRRK